MEVSKRPSTNCHQIIYIRQTIAKYLSMSNTSIIWTLKIEDDRTYFQKTEDGDTLCNICSVKSCKNCKNKNPCVLKGYHASNARKHLRSFHDLEYKKLDEKEKEDKEEPPRKQQKIMTQNTCQSDINNFFSKNQCPKKVIEEQKCLFARFMARPTIPISIVENQEFRNRSSEMV
uniref:BED-type domain-containing protein n=1 Tax=Meloidogyne incognita TaxID=6306 RepID=A0A914NIH3_MELIC